MALPAVDTPLSGYNVPSRPEARAAFIGVPSLPLQSIRQKDDTPTRDMTGEGEDREGVGRVMLPGGRLIRLVTLRRISAPCFAGSRSSR